MVSLISNNQSFLSSLSNVEARILKDQLQVSSGLALQQVSDNPDEVSALLQVKAALAHNTQLQYNLGRVTTEVNSAEGAINSAVSLMDRARQIATEGASSLTGSTTDSQLASQVKDIITEMQGLTNTQVEGRYVFSGNSDQTPPYAGVDLTQANGVGAYQGSNATRTIEHPNGSTFAVSLTAQQIFDSGDPSTSVFQSLTGLYNALVSGDSSSIAAATSNIATATTYLDGQQAIYGDIQNQVADATTYQSNLNVQFQQQLSTLEDADTATAITDMQQATVAEQAALQSHAALPTKTLFSYLG
ncbi:MAG: flagellin [Bryobacteraceae bacterium]